MVLLVQRCVFAAIRSYCAHLNWSILKIEEKFDTGTGGHIFQIAGEEPPVLLVFNNRNCPGSDTGAKVNNEMERVPNKQCC